MPQTDVDRTAQILSQLARMLRACPPVWDGAGISTPVLGPHGEGVGRALLGRGLYLDMDLNALGITREVPGVFERSRVQRFVDRMVRRGVDPDWAERGAITSLAGIVANRANGLRQDVTEFVASVSNFYHANIYTPTFRYNGGAYTSIPGGVAHDSLSAGAFSGGLTNPLPGNRKYLMSVGIGTSGAVNCNMAILADLLVAAGGIDCTSTSPQTINSVPLPRYTNGKGVLATFDISSTLGSGAATLTLTQYTNQGGTPGQVSPAVAFVPSAIAPELGPDRSTPIMRLATGDYGVRSVEEVQIAVGMSAGVCNLNLYFPLAFIPMILNRSYEERDFNNHIDGLVELVTGSNGNLGCLVFYLMGSATTSSSFLAHLKTVEG